MRVIMAVLAGVIAIATLAMLMGIKVDLLIAQFFYDPSQQKFFAATHRFVGFVRDKGMVAWLTCGGFVVAALVTRLLRRPSVVPARVVIFLVSTLALGPGLVVNGILKKTWDRPRPVHVTEFGGIRTFTDWWQPRASTCQSDCRDVATRRRAGAPRSFVSGETASAAWMFAPAMLAPPQWRIAAYAGAAIFTVVVSLARMAAGGHFFTDVLFAALLTMIVIWGMYGVIFRWRRTAAEIE